MNLQPVVPVGRPLPSRMPQAFTRWHAAASWRYRAVVPRKSLTVHPPETVTSRSPDLGWSTHVDIADAGDLRAVPFLRVTVSQPMYAPSSRATIEARTAALHEAFAAIVRERFAARAPFSPKPLARCTVQQSRFSAAEGEQKAKT